MSFWCRAEPWAVTTALTIAGCSTGEQRRESDSAQLKIDDGAVAATRSKAPPQGDSRSLTGAWTAVTRSPGPGATGARERADVRRRELFVGFVRPGADEAIVWAVAPALPAPLAPARRREFPAPSDPQFEHLSDLDVSVDWVVVLQPDAAWVRDTGAAGPAASPGAAPADDGKLRRPCWGSNSFGAVGVPHAYTVAAPTTLDVGGSVVHVASGGSHNCAVLTDDTLRCWGGAVFGRLGLGHEDVIGDDETPASAGPVPY